MTFGSAGVRTYTHTPQPGQEGYDPGYDTTSAGWDPSSISAPATGNHDRDVALTFAERQARAAHDAAMQGAFVGSDPTAAGYQSQALQALGSRAFGGDLPGAGSAQTAMLTSPYAAQRGPQGAAQGQNMLAGLTTAGRQGAQGAGQALEFQNQANKGRLGAAQAYGETAAAQRLGSDRNAEFNATQQGELTSRLYQALYAAATGAQKRQDAQNAQDAQAAIQGGTTALSLIGAIAGA
jgi:hypothetical protein